MNLDFTMMLSYHEALRRDVAAVAEVARVVGDDPARWSVTHLGWQNFTRFLVVHHTAEDDVLWPLMRVALGERTDDVARTSSPTSWVRTSDTRRTRHCR